MKNIYYFKSLFRTSLVALCLLTAEIGQMRAGTRRIYFDYSAVSWWKDYTNLNSGAGFAKVHCWGGNSGDQDYTMSALAGQTDLAYCDIDDGWTNICFFRCGSDGTWWTKTHNYDGIGSNNRFKIKNDADNDGIDKYKWADSGAAIRWVPGVSIDGLIDVHNPHNQAFSFSGNDGTYAVTLSAHSTYQFCIRDGSTRYTLDNNVWTSNISNYTLNTSGHDIRLTTAGAGTYTFTYNKSTHVISVAYPTVSHPNIDYCYMYGYTDWDHKYLHVWNSSSSIAGTTWPGTEMFNYVTISDEKYYYYAPGDYANSKPNDNSGNQTDDLTNSQGYSKYMKHNGSTWVWNTFTVSIQLENEDATTAGTENQDIAFNSGVLSDITCPTKTHYDFQGYYTEDGGTGTQVIDKDGHWIASVTDYTDASKHWIHAGMSTTIYAKWTEHEYTITTAVSPAGAGAVSLGSTKAKYVTPTGDITATANAGWVFKEWQFSKTNEDYDAYPADDYNSYSNPVHINAVHNGTLTAVFEPRYYLVGKIWDDSADGGMPGWSNYNKPFKVVTTSPVLDTCKLTLSTNTSFYIMVRDKADGFSYGKSSETLEDNETLTFTDKDNKVFVYSNGGTEYTFKITAIDGNGRPTVSVERPYQVNVGRKRVDIDGADHDDNTGGTAAMSLTSGGDAVANGAWVPYGTGVTYAASPASGYTLAWFTASDYAYQFSTVDTFYHIATSTGNGYAKFTEKATTVALAATNGKIQIGGVDKTATTAGVTTTRSLTAVPNDGYYFTGWTKTSGADYNISSTSANPTTLSGRGSGASFGQTLTANFALRYSIKGTMNSENWGTDHFISNFETVGGKVIGYVEMTLSANTSYEFAIYDLANSEWLKSGSNQVYYMTNGNSYVWDFSTSKTYNCGITTAGAGTYRFMWNITDKTMSVIYPNFVIYRSGDKSDDPRATEDDVESYDGGTISKAIEFRMKVRDLDMWYTLCLPFTVNAVKVWDEEDGQYYAIEPYYRTEVGATLNGGHYIIRKPKQTIDLPISEFGDWRDPTSATDYVPTKDTAYIIQWHNLYFLNKYVSFFGATGQTIPTSFTAGAAPSADNVVNVHGNNSMQSGSVAGAYLFEADYGNGAWLRSENVNEARTINPFECYVRASSGTTGRFLVIRRGMTIEDTATGWDDVLNSETKEHILVYSLSGICVTQLHDCSLKEAGQRLSESLSEGLYILYAGNESVKLMVGGK